jgi:hypothetical protein
MASMSAKVREALRDDFRGREIGLRALADERQNGGGEGCPERPRLGRAGVGIPESGKGLSGKVVVTAGLHCRQPLAQARKGERVGAHGTDVMLGLPDTPALDARARVERVDDAPPEQISRDRRRGNEQVTRRHGTPGLVSGRRAEEKPESRAGGTKLSRRCHRQVELKRVRQQEYAVGGRAALKIGELYRAEFSGERGRPIIENLGDRDVAGDAEREVQVGEAIAAAHSERPHHGPGYDPAVLLREPQHALAEGISLLDGEHAYFPRFFAMVDLGTLAVHGRDPSQRGN